MAVGFKGLVSLSETATGLIYKNNTINLLLLGVGKEKRRVQRGRYKVRAGRYAFFCDVLRAVNLQTVMDFSRQLASLSKVLR